MDGGSTITCNFSQEYLLSQLEQILADASPAQVMALLDKISVRSRKPMQCFTLAPMRGAPLVAANAPQAEGLRKVKRVANILAH